MICMKEVKDDAALSKQLAIDPSLKLLPPPSFVSFHHSPAWLKSGLRYGILVNLGMNQKLPSQQDFTLYFSFFMAPWGRNLFLCRTINKLKQEEWTWSY